MHSAFHCSIFLTCMALFLLWTRSGTKNGTFRRLGVALISSWKVCLYRRRTPTRILWTNSTYSCQVRLLTAQLNSKHAYNVESIDKFEQTDVPSPHVIPVGDEEHRVDDLAGGHLSGLEDFKGEEVEADRVCPVVQREEAAPPVGLLPVQPGLRERFLEHRIVRGHLGLTNREWSTVHS